MWTSSWMLLWYHKRLLRHSQSRHSQSRPQEIDSYSYRVQQKVKVSVLPHSAVASIGCYDCASYNGSDPGCEDPFIHDDAKYDQDCQAFKEHFGRESANYCIKIKGISSEGERWWWWWWCTSTRLEKSKGDRSSFLSSFISFPFIQSVCQSVDHVDSSPCNDPSWSM